MGFSCQTGHRWGLSRVVTSRNYPLRQWPDAAVARTVLCRHGLTVMESKRKSYIPPDPTQIEAKPEALDYWARTLETDPEKIRRALSKVGPILEKVKQELGIGGIG